tara:strand:- start:239 stop:493 length:255 start_codon:yes stop_codon:yes gene_type:complete
MNDNKYLKLTSSGLVEKTEPEKALQDKLEKAYKERIADYPKFKYKDDRREEYPSIVDQLDEIYHKGLTEWKKTIKAVKDKHPKP